MDQHVVEMFHEWLFYSASELMQSAKRQSEGLTTCIYALILHTPFEQSRHNVVRMKSIVTYAHYAFKRFSKVVLKKVPHIDVLNLPHVVDYQRINLMAIDILDVVNDFLSRLHNFLTVRKIIIIFMRIVFKLRIRVERYLVAVDYWSKNY